MKYFFKNVLIIGDNSFLLEKIYNILLTKKNIQHINFAFGCSAETRAESISIPRLMTIDVCKDICSIIKKYDLIISVHCRQIFPAELIKNVKCINVHPGFNPYNRGWYPHIFSIINKLPTGVTIHEIDEKIDHGHIIAQEEVSIFSSDTSEDVYNRILELGIKLFFEHIESILRNSYKTLAPQCEGNINSVKDFLNLREIDLRRMYSGEEIINLLRALSHGSYRNAYFLDDKKKKIFVRIILENE